MGRFTKRIIGGLAAALTLAGGAVAGTYSVANFDDGKDINSLGYYFYLYGYGSPSECNRPEIGWLQGVDRADTAYGPVKFVPYTHIDGCNDGSANCGYLVVDPFPQFRLYNTTDERGQYYPGFGFGMTLTEGDDVGFGADFSKVDSIVFYAKSDQAGTIGKFQLQTIENSSNLGSVFGSGYSSGCAGTAYEKSVPKSEDEASAYELFFDVATVWTRHSIAIKPITKPGKDNGEPYCESSTCATANGEVEQGHHYGGKAGVLKQGPYVGLTFEFKPENVTKLAWVLDGEKNATFAGEKLTLYIDNVQFVGSQVDDKFFIPPHVCQGCVSANFTAPTPNKVLSTFEGTDGPTTDPDYLLNSRGYYWYSYTDEVGRGTDSGASFITGLIPNPPGDSIMNTVGNGREPGGRGAAINFETGTSYTRPGGTAKIEAFVGIGANLYDDSASLQGRPNEDYLNASAFTGIYFEYFTSTDVKNLNVEITDMCDAAGYAADDDGEVFYTQVEGTGETWAAAKINFTQFVLPSWVKTSGVRRGEGNRCGATLDKSRLAQLKFKVEGGGIAGTVKIDNVAFFGAADWGTGVSVRHSNIKADKASGLRAVYNRGVVGVNWSAAQNIESGRVSLVNVKGRIVASAPLVKAGGKVTANLGKGAIPTGMYFVRVNAKDVQGRKIVQQVPLSIVK